MKQMFTFLAILVSLSISAQPEFNQSSKTAYKEISGSKETCSKILCLCKKGSYMYRSSYHTSDNSSLLDIVGSNIGYVSNTSRGDLPASPSYKFHDITFLGFTKVERLAFQVMEASNIQPCTHSDHYAYKKLEILFVNDTKLLG